MSKTEALGACMNLLSAMERALESAPLPILITEARLSRPGPRIVFVNRAFCASTRYRAAELIGQSPRLLQGPRTNRVLMRELVDRLKSGLPFQGKTINYRKDGTPYLARWNISPICDDSGKITHYVSFQLHVNATAAEA